MTPGRVDLEVVTGRLDIAAACVRAAAARRRGLARCGLFSGLR
jgi:hypothetical protein